MCRWHNKKYIYWQYAKKMLLYLEFMSLLSPDQLDKLTMSMDLFRPSGLNDDLRVDLTEGDPFVAVDTRGPNEIDDAIRVKYSRQGGFLLQTAIADGSQLSASPDHVREALEMGESTYRGSRCITSMLPEVTIRQLELTPARSPQRALVIQSRFDANARPTADTEIYPATVRVETYRQAEFATHYLRGRGGANAPIARFSQALRDGRPDLNYDLPVALDGSKSNIMYGCEVAQDHMVLANHGITQAAMQRDIPLLYRRYPSVEATWGQGPGTRDRTFYLLGVEAPAEAEIPYARATSPLHEGVSLANHLLFGAFMAGEPLDAIGEMAFDMQGVLNK